MSLLREIQGDIARPDSEISCVLLKCKVLAARLGTKELDDWASWELTGYPESTTVPDYRHLPITYYAAFMNPGWRQDKAPIPIQIVPEKYRQSFREVEFRDGIAKAASLSAADTGVVAIQRPELVFAVQGKMYPEMNCYSVWGEIPKNEFQQLLSAVKTRILDFALTIEEKNPAAGEAAPNTTPVPKEEVSSLVRYIFNGPVGAVSLNGDITQNVNISLKDADVGKLARELAAHIDELDLDDRQRERARAQLAVIQTELSGKPDRAVIAAAGRTLRNITEGAIGSLLAAAAQPGIWSWIHQVLAGFPK